MSHKKFNKTSIKLNDNAIIFAALGNKIRLKLLIKLADGQSYSIAQLTENSQLTRQAITKHLVILEDAKVVTSLRTGRESLYKFAPEPLEKIKDYLNFVSKQWDQALSRLKSFVED
jgi:DNA-binding transcriptional ArsR family regulator